MPWANMHLVGLDAIKIWLCRVEPIMGAGYHTIHHTTYQHNYGHYFIFMDYLFGTLKVPDSSKCPPIVA